VGDGALKVQSDGQLRRRLLLRLIGEQMDINKALWEVEWAPGKSHLGIVILMTYRILIGKAIFGRTQIMSEGGRAGELKITSRQDQRVVLWQTSYLWAALFHLGSSFHHWCLRR
jgi:hypothetical protein